MVTSHLKFTGLLLGVLLSLGALAADSIALNPAHPDRYVVVKGDTLWDISARFLRDPWRWPDVWQVNPQINNPHLIYPGDMIELSYVNGQPRLTLKRGSTVKLSPKIRSDDIGRAIPTIPIDAIHHFLSRSYVMSPEEMDHAPYVVAFANEHVLGANNIQAYVREIQTEEHLSFDVVRPGPEYKDADTGETLGYEALFITGAELQKTGDPATTLLTDMQLETIAGDRLVPAADDQPMEAFVPSRPDNDINGSIISVLNGVSQVGQYQVVAIDRGETNGLKPGDVLIIDRRGETVRDSISKKWGEKVKLPNERAGLMMVFRTFPRVSYALVMAAEKSIHVLDRVHSPDR